MLVSLYTIYGRFMIMGHTTFGAAVFFIIRAIDAIINKAMQNMLMEKNPSKLQLKSNKIILNIKNWSILLKTLFLRLKKEIRKIGAVRNIVCVPKHFFYLNKIESGLVFIL